MGYRKTEREGEWVEGKEEPIFLGRSLTFDSLLGILYAAI